MTPQKAFQDMRVTVGETELVLRPTFEAICEIEERLGSLLSYALDIAQKRRQAGFRDVAAIVYGGIVGAGNPRQLTFEDVGEMVREAGVLDLVAPTFQFVAGIVFKKAKGGEEKKTEAAAAQEAVPAPNP